MSRRKILPDSDVLAEARRLFLADGEKALSFGNLSRATGLAASTLAQRFATVEGLQAAAARAGWQAMIAETDAADLSAAGKGPQGYLKALDARAAQALLTLGARDPEAGRMAQEWRGRVETALALRLGQADGARAAARVLFAAWQGQGLWDPAGAEPLRLKDLAKRLA
ncbi:transcriptional regulator [Pseudogemmobacter sonorensis]|uniref:transcriptional regulator n=1 Tax=Pseudogemmobacter sonorensis TaxID=2989681 RepID=UPI00369CABFA